MSLRLEQMGPVPDETARVARAAFPKGNVYLRLRDVLGTIFEDALFADLFSPTGQPALAPWRLALICVFQFLEDLSDRQAAEAVRSRIDWKYVLGLDLSDPGFDFTVLSEFRARLIAHEAGQRLFDRLIERLSQGGWIKKRGVQRSDSTHVLAAVRRLNRLELVGETLRAALNTIAELEAQWLKDWVPVAWFERYSRRVEDYRLPAGKAAQEQLGEQIGLDGSRLLDAVFAQAAPDSLSRLPEIEILRQVWLQQFVWQEGHIHLRNKDDLPPAHLTLRSPYDVEAHFGHKRDLKWFGYKVHFSETCESDLPHLITHVVSTDATKTDVEETEAIHQALAKREVLPGQHLVDAGYVDAQLLLQSQQRYGIELLGPVSQNNQWQAKAGQGYELASFGLDWQAKVATCPAGKQSVKWTQSHDQHGHPRLTIRFGLQQCRQCPCRPLCTRAAQAPRTLSVRPQAEHEVLEQARSQQQQQEFRQSYAQRAGIEGTHAQAIRALGLRRSRYIGLSKTSLQHLLTAAAINLIRLDAFLAGKKPAKTRTSRFAALVPDELVS